jgi:hypothetical protein
MSYTVIANSIMGKTAFGLLINLHIQDYFPATEAIMYYNYVAIFCVVLWSAYAGQSNESRYAFTTPLMAALMVFVGWLHADDAVTYWGIILFCLLLGALMYLNDMNHEKYGVAGPGDKLLAVAFMIVCFTATMGFVSSETLGVFPDTGSAGTSQNIMCGSAYTCDSSGNIALDVSVTSVKDSGGFSLDVISIGMALAAMEISALKLLLVVVGSVLFFSVVMLAAYPALADSTQVVAFLAVLNVVIWAIYILAFFRWMYKPVPGTGDM